MQQGEKSKMIQRDRRLKSNEITTDMIEHIVDKIVSEIEPEKIILFGSHAKDSTALDSDLDLFVIKDGDVENREIRKKLICYYLGGASVLTLLSGSRKRLRQI